MPAPVNTLLRTADYAYLFDDFRGGKLVVYSSEYAQEVEPALKQVSSKGCTVDAFVARCPRPRRGRKRGCRADRRLLLALLLGLDRHAERRRAPASRH